MMGRPSLTIEEAMTRQYRVSTKGQLSLPLIFLGMRIRAFGKMFLVKSSGENSCYVYLSKEYAEKHLMIYSEDDTLKMDLAYKVKKRAK